MTLFDYLTNETVDQIKESDQLQMSAIKFILFPYFFVSIVRIWPFHQGKRTKTKTRIGAKHDSF